MSRILIGNVRDKLINNLLATKAGTGALDAAQGKVLKDLVESVLGQQADIYSKKTYAVGDYCIYENALYKCNTAISSAEEWTAGHWTKTTIAAELKNIVGSVATVNNAITELNSKTANWEQLWHGSVAEGNPVIFDKKAYKTFAIEIMATSIIIVTIVNDEQKNVVAGTAVLLHNGTKYVPFFRSVYIDVYNDHFWFGSVADYDPANGLVYSDGRIVTAIYGIK